MSDAIEIIKLHLLPKHLKNLEKGKPFSMSASELANRADLDELHVAKKMATKIRNALKKGSGVRVQADSVKGGKINWNKAIKSVAKDPRIQSLAKSAVKSVVNELPVTGKQKELMQDLGNSLVSSKQGGSIKSAVAKLTPHQKDLFNQLEKSLHEPISGGKLSKAQKTFAKDFMKGFKQGFTGVMKEAVGVVAQPNVAAALAASVATGNPAPVVGVIAANTVNRALEANNIKARITPKQAESGIKAATEYLAENPPTTGSGGALAPMGSGIHNKPKKGSPEMIARMAAMRAKRGKK